MKMHSCRKTDWMTRHHLVSSPSPILSWISTHWATDVFATQLVDALNQQLLLVAVFDSRDLENMSAALHPDKKSESETSLDQIWGYTLCRSHNSLEVRMQIFLFDHMMFTMHLCSWKNVQFARQTNSKIMSVSHQTSLSAPYLQYLWSRTGKKKRKTIH